MKGDTYNLVRKDDGEIVAKFIVESDSETHVIGNCFENGGMEDQFIAHVYAKFDSCTHWHFYGEDYDEEITKEPDSYYHLCGPYCFAQHIRCMCFVWKLVRLLMRWHELDCEIDKDIEGYYCEYEKANELVALMLEGFKIEKGE